MKHLKTFETFETFDLMEPEPGYLIVYNHVRGEEMLKWLEDNLGTRDNPLKEFISPKYPESKFYGKSKNNILLRHDYQDRKNDDMWVHYYKIWSIFSSEFKLNDTEVKEIIEWWVVDTLQIRASNTDAEFNALPLKL